MLIRNIDTGKEYQDSWDVFNTLEIGGYYLVKDVESQRAAILYKARHDRFIVDFETEGDSHIRWRIDGILWSNSRWLSDVREHLSYAKPASDISRDISRDKARSKIASALDCIQIACGDILPAYSFLGFGYRNDSLYLGF